MLRPHLIVQLLFMLPLVACSQQDKPMGTTSNTQTTKRNNMQIEIWSDIVCPFCYIGKRKLEQALEQFTHNDQVTIVWKSFQLDPEAPATGQDYLKTLSERKGWSIEQTRQITENVTKMAAEVGLNYHFDKAISANSLDAHRLLHLAHQRGLQDSAKEALFKAHFIEGKNIADHGLLIELGKTVGLDATEVERMLKSTEHVEAVNNDIEEARQLRVSGVPFFVFDSKYAVSGAQPTEVFLNTLNKAFQEWKSNK